ncbi:MAG: 3-phosphoshikimate 1-carboxyvinyltransferase [Chitinophagaceae bacterium]
MIARIQPGEVEGQLQAPPSKSAMQRACAAALLSGGETILHHFGSSNDDRAAIEIIKGLGARVDILDENRLHITSNGVHPLQSKLNCGESGLSLRMFTPIAALSEQPILLTGSGTLMKRPMHFFDDVLPALGVRVSSNNGMLPLQVKGPLHPRDIEIDGSVSSQFLTGLLMAFIGANARGVSIKVKHLNSKPYVAVTLDLMSHFGMKMPFYDASFELFQFDDTPPSLSSGVHKYHVEGDWSGAAFLLVAGAIGSSVCVAGLDPQSKQADRAVLDALSAAEANVMVTNAYIQVTKTKLKAFQFDATECPDLFPPLAVLAAYAEGVSVIKGVSRLLHKESNRGEVLQQELKKMGVSIELNNDDMMITGRESLQAGVLHSHHDHRIAMAAAVAALGAYGTQIIEDAEAVAKSYPNFFEDLRKLGVQVSLSH